MCKECHRCAFVIVWPPLRLFFSFQKWFHTSDFKRAGEFSQTLLLVTPSLLALSATFVPLLDVDKRADRKGWCAHTSLLLLCCRCKKKKEKGYTFWWTVETDVSTMTLKHFSDRESAKVVETITSLLFCAAKTEIILFILMRHHWSDTSCLRKRKRHFHYPNMIYGCKNRDQPSH